MIANLFRLPAVPHTRLVRCVSMLAVAVGGLLLATSVWIAVSNLRAARAGDALGLWISNAEAAAERLLSTLKDAETGQRGYLLTGREAYLAPYEAAEARLAADFARLEQAVPPDAATQGAAQGRIARMRGLAEAKMAELRETIALYQSGAVEAAVEAVRTDRGQRDMDALRAETEAMNRGFAARIATAQARARSAWAWIGPAALGVLASLIFGILAWEQRRVRRIIAVAFVRLERFTHAFGLAQGLLRTTDGRITFWDAGAEDLYGYRAAEALGQVGHDLLRTRFPEPLAGIEAQLKRDGEWQGELVQRRRDGVEITVVSRWAMHPGGAGEPGTVIEIGTDVTAQRRAEAERERAARLLETIVEAAPSLIYAKDRDGRMLLANPPVLRLVGKPWSEVQGRTDREFLDDPAQAEAVMANDRRIMETGQPEELEELAGGEGAGRPRIWLSTKTPLYAGDGQLLGLVGVSVEITERKQAEERRRLLVHELNHRVKNTLATVQAIAAQTLRGTDPAIRWTLEARLRALAAAHDVLTAESWTGATLHDLVSGVLAPHGGTAEGRFDVTGPALRLAPAAALALTLGLHELATNALKYGALAAPAGRVRLRWEVVPGERPLFRLSWTEQGGPHLDGPPSRRGFGTRLIERSVAHDLRGTVRLDFAPSGLTCLIEAPLADVATPPEPKPLTRVGIMKETGP